MASRECTACILRESPAVSDRCGRGIKSSPARGAELQRGCTALQCCVAAVRCAATRCARGARLVVHDQRADVLVEHRLHAFGPHALRPAVRGCAAPRRGRRRVRWRRCGAWGSPFNGTALSAHNGADHAKEGHWPMRITGAGNGRITGPVKAESDSPPAPSRPTRTPTSPSGPSARCNGTACNIQHTAPRSDARNCSTQHIICSTHHATYNPQHAPRNMAVCSDTATAQCGGALSARLCRTSAHSTAPLCTCRATAERVSPAQMRPQCALWTTPARPRQELGGGGGSRNARRALRLLLRCAALAIRAHCRPHARRNGADLLLQQRLEVQQRLVALQHSQSVGLVPRSAVAAMRRS